MYIKQTYIPIMTYNYILNSMKWTSNLLMITIEPTFVYFCIYFNNNIDVSNNNFVTYTMHT